MAQYLQFRYLKWPLNVFSGPKLWPFYLGHWCQTDICTIYNIYIYIHIYTYIYVYQFWDTLFSEKSAWLQNVSLWSCLWSNFASYPQTDQASGTEGGKTQNCPASDFVELYRVVCSKNLWVSQTSVSELPGNLEFGH
jgi:hypothetical protein